MKIVHVGDGGTITAPDPLGAFLVCVGEAKEIATRTVYGEALVAEALNAGITRKQIEAASSIEGRGGTETLRALIDLRQPPVRRSTDRELP